MVPILYSWLVGNLVVILKTPDLDHLIYPKEEAMRTTNYRTRRQFLKAAGIATGTLTLAACAPAAPRPAHPPRQPSPAQEAPTEEPAQAAPAEPAAAPVTLRYRTWHTPEGSVGDKAWYDWLTENYPRRRYHRV